MSGAPKLATNEDVAALLGVDLSDKLTTAFSVRCEAGKLPVVTTRKLISKDSADTVLQVFRLVPIEETKNGKTV